MGEQARAVLSSHEGLHQGFRRRVRGLSNDAGDGRGRTLQAPQGVEERIFPRHRRGAVAGIDSPLPGIDGALARRRCFRRDEDLLQSCRHSNLASHDRGGLQRLRRRGACVRISRAEHAYTGRIPEIHAFDAQDEAVQKAHRATPGGNSRVPHAGAEKGKAAGFCGRAARTP